MTDLSRILPDFPAGRFANLLPAIERHGLTVADLLTLQVADIGKRTQLPLLDIKRLCHAVLDALHVDLGVSDKQPAGERDGGGESVGAPLKRTGTELLAAPPRFVSTLDDALDAALGGGVPAGYVTEIVGESGAGKTQLLLTLLLAVQLPPPRGLGRPALYVSTEAPLSTRRLAQLLAHHPLLQDLPPSERPSLDRIVGTVTPDLESQDHILNFQVPVEVARRGAGLLVVDSVAANYRVEFERGSGGGSANNLAARGHELARLGRLLHELARRHDLAVVVANQVADRFAAKSGAPPVPRPPSYSLPRVSQESPLASRGRYTLPLDPPSSSSNSNTTELLLRSSMPEPPPPPEEAPAPAALLLDHQQRWFTGWGDDARGAGGEQPDLKTPSLGLVWTTQVAARVALLKRPAYGPRREVVLDEEEEEEEEGRPNTTAALRNWRRWMKVVFAPHVAGAGPGLDGAVEFEVTMGGLRAVDTKDRAKAKAKGKGKGKGKDRE
ncbi:DNA repair protein RAD57 [Hypoxylon cercidicola]|nr:DNA repair protein RAD57 [Hypoxylon cercidicola]